jgi:hypothetical protein
MRDDLWAQGQVQDPSPCIGAWQTSRVIALAIQLALTGVYGSSFSFSYFVLFSSLLHSLLPLVLSTMALDTFWKLQKQVQLFFDSWDSTILF